MTLYKINQFVHNIIPTKLVAKQPRVPKQQIKALALTVFVSSWFLSGCNDNKSQQEANTLNTKDHPNIIIFYVSNLDYRDLGAYGAKEVKTPNIDMLAQNGVLFTDAHSYSSKSVSSHYALLTGEYAFRENISTKDQSTGLIIPEEKPTLANTLKNKGYNTAVIGQWLLGLGEKGLGQIDLPTDSNNKVLLGPENTGFSYSFITAGSFNTQPTIYLEDQFILDFQTTEPQTKKSLQQSETMYNVNVVNDLNEVTQPSDTNTESTNNKFYSVFTNMANFFIEDNKNDPFFLLYAFNDINEPKLFNKELSIKKLEGMKNLQTKTAAIEQMDLLAGQVINKLKSENLFDNTLIIFTSDNGSMINEEVADTRVPMIMHFPKKIKPSVSQALMSQVDLYASIASLLKINLSDDIAIDSENHLDSWLGLSANGRSEVIQDLDTLSLRTSDYKYIPINKDLTASNADLSNSPQLYNLTNDKLQTTNIALQQAVEVKNYQQAFENITGKKKSD